MQVVSRSNLSDTDVPTAEKRPRGHAKMLSFNESGARRRRRSRNRTHLTVDLGTNFTKSMAALVFCRISSWANNG